MPSTSAVSISSPQVHTVIQLGDRNLHPRQLAYDQSRNGLWFWTSTQEAGTSFNNRIYFYNISRQQLRSWPIYSGDWSSQLLAGIAVAPNGDIWLGWNHNLVDFQPATGRYARYTVPQIQYPLPTAVLGNLPQDLGIADVAVASNGTVWLARYGALSLTAFSPLSQTFHEIALPANAGDPAKLAIDTSGKIFFTINLSADHPGHGAEKVGIYDPTTGNIHILDHPALSLAVTPSGDLYTALRGADFGIQRLTATERTEAATQHRSPAFERWAVPFDVDDSAIATDKLGRIWVAVGGSPELALFNPVTKRVQLFRYAAPSIANNPLPFIPPGANPGTPAPGAVWLSHIIAMVTDSQGHLWYIRAGYSNIEEVAA